MAEVTLKLYDVSQLNAQNGIGQSFPNVFDQALWGDAFRWQNFGATNGSDNISFTLPATTVDVSFDDADGMLQENPHGFVNVNDQLLTQDVSIDGDNYQAGTETTLWQYPAPVFVELVYTVELYDPAGNMYTMAGVSITEGYNHDVVGITFVGDQPPAGTTLTYIQGVSVYDNTPAPIPIADIICFTAGTKIDTPNGGVAVENLKVGDLVLTMDEGPKPIRWIGKTTVQGIGKFAPVRFETNAIGNSQPFMVSPNHRVLINGPMAELHFGETEVLVPAKALVNGDTITQTDQAKVTYFHILLNGHEVIYANGAPTESLFTGEMAMSALDDDARAEIAALFPNIDQRPVKPARPIMSYRETRAVFGSGAPIHA